MRFEAYHRLDGRPNVILDGSPTVGTVLTVTHWPGFPTPPGITADTSAQMAFQLLDRADLTAGAELVSNNHFDQDGVVSILALTNPDESVPRRRLLEAVASAGDFGVTTDRSAARLSAALAALADGAEGALGEFPGSYDEQCRVLYEYAIEHLIAWADEPALARHLWEADDINFDRSEQAFTAGLVTIEEIADVDLAVVRIDPQLGDAHGHRFGGSSPDWLHPIAVFNRTQRSVVARLRGASYEVELRYEGWVQYVSRPIRARRDLGPLAERLNDIERGTAVWTADDVGGLTPKLRSGEGDSSIAADDFVALVADHLRSAPPAWDPFAPRQ